MCGCTRCACLGDRDDGVDPNRILVVAGASAGFTLAFLALFDPGDRVGVIEPGYPCYRNALLALGMEPVPIPVGAARRWAPTSGRPRCRRPPRRARARSPSNPTGTVLAADASPRSPRLPGPRIAVIADEIYHGIVDGPAGRSGTRPHPDAFVVNSFSKYWSMTGWRVGWVVVPDSLVETIERLQQNLYICAPHVSQVAALAALEATEELDGHVTRYHENRSIIIDGLATAGITDIALPTARSTCTPTFLTSRRRSASTRCNSPHAGSTNSESPPHRESTSTSPADTSTSASRTPVPATT